MIFSNQQNSTKTNHLKTGMVSVALCATVFLTACGGEHEEVKAVDKVDEAAEMAAENAPEPEPIEGAGTEATITAEEDTTDGAEATAESSDTDDVATATTDVAAESEGGELSADAGKQLYDSTCSTCHASGLLDAPKYGDAAAWESRIAQGKETLYKHSAEGFNQMPAQATGDVTEEQVHAAVDYMVDAVS